VPNLNRERFAEKLNAEVMAAYRRQEERNGEEQMRQLERIILLQIVDSHWKEHLLNMDHLKEGIGLRGYGQKNPLNEYKKEGFNLFMSMIETVKEKTVGTLMRVQVVRDEEIARLEEEQRRKRQEMAMNLGAAGVQNEKKPVKRTEEKVGRNEPMPLRFRQKIQEVLRPPVKNRGPPSPVRCSGRMNRTRHVSARLSAPVSFPAGRC
jgi:preprotein translocase subunit SecA